MRDDSAAKPVGEEWTQPDLDDMPTNQQHDPLAGAVRTGDRAGDDAKLVGGEGVWQAIEKGVERSSGTVGGGELDRKSVV